MQIPKNTLSKYFSDVTIIDAGDNWNITCYINLYDLPGGKKEGWKTAICINTPIYSDYFPFDGLKASTSSRSEHTNLLKKEAYKISQILVKELDQDSKTLLFYGSVGQQNQQVEEISIIQEEHFTSSNSPFPLLAGPRSKYGPKQFIIPPINYFSTRFPNAKRLLLVVFSDGDIEDMEKLPSFTIERKNQEKNSDISEIKVIFYITGKAYQKGRLDNIISINKNIPPDEWLWDYKLASELEEITPRMSVEEQERLTSRNKQKLLAKLTDDSVVVALFGKIFDAEDNLIYQFRDGVPAMFQFELPKSSPYFSVKIKEKENVYTIKQPISFT